MSSCIYAQDSKFPKDTGINPRLADVKDQKNARNYRLTLRLPAHSLAVSRFDCSSVVGTVPLTANCQS